MSRSVNLEGGGGTSDDDTSGTTTDTSGGSTSGGGASGSSRTTTPTRGRSSGSSGGSSGGSDDDSSPSVRERFSSTIDSVRDRPGGTVAAAGLGAAAIPEPTPITETGGLAVAGTALAAGAGIEAARQSEIGVPSRETFTSSEVETPTTQRRPSEVSVGTGDMTQSEIATPTSQRPRPEVGVPADRSTPSEVGVPGVEAAQQVGIGQQPRREIGEEEEFVIGRDTIDDVEETGELGEDERLRQIREQLEDRQEFVRDVPDGGRTGGGVRFPAEEAATGTAPSIADQFDFGPEVTPEQSLGAGTAGSGLSEDFVGGLEQERDQATGTEFASPTTGQQPLADLNDRGGTGTEPTADTGGVTDTDAGTGTGFDGGTGTAEVTATMIEESLAIGTQQSQALAQQQTDAVADEFAQPEQTAFEQQFAEPTQVGQQTGQGRTPRERPRLPFEDGDSDDVDAFGFETEDERFGTGFLSGSEAVEDLFGR